MMSLSIIIPALILINIKLYSISETNENIQGVSTEINY